MDSGFCEHSSCDTHGSSVQSAVALPETNEDRIRGSISASASSACHVVCSGHSGFSCFVDVGTGAQKSRCRVDSEWKGRSTLSASCHRSVSYKKLYDQQHLTIRSNHTCRGQEVVWRQRRLHPQHSVLPTLVAGKMAGAGSNLVGPSLMVERCSDRSKSAHVGPVVTLRLFMDFRMSFTRASCRRSPTFSSPVCKAPALNELRPQVVAQHHRIFALVGTPVGSFRAQARWRSLRLATADRRRNKRRSTRVALAQRQARLRHRRLQP